MIDTHAHLNMYEEEYEKVIIKNMEEDNLQAVVTIGTTIEDSIKNIELASNYENVYATVGIYPDFSLTTTEKDLEKLKELAKNEKVVAIGEIGLNYYGDEYDIESQKQLFIKQLEIANELNLPFCIHCREAAEDMYEVLNAHKHLIKHAGIMHCYSEGKDWFKKFLDLGLYLSFSGNITYKKSDRSFLKEIPLDRILIETDAPYLSPEPIRGRRNEPKNVKFIIEKIASEIGITPEELDYITTKNAKNVYFKIKKG